MGESAMHQEAQKVVNRLLTLPRDEAMTAAYNSAREGIDDGVHKPQALSPLKPESPPAMDELAGAPTVPHHEHKTANDYEAEAEHQCGKECEETGVERASRVSGTLPNQAQDPGQYQEAIPLYGRGGGGHLCEKNRPCRYCLHQLAYSRQRPAKLHPRFDDPATIHWEWNHSVEGPIYGPSWRHVRNELAQHNVHVDNVARIWKKTQPTFQNLGYRRIRP